MAKTTREAGEKRKRLRRRWNRLKRRLWQAYYTFKYLPFRANWVNADAPADQRGFVCIQIDGLAHEHLLLAMRRGYMRHLRRWQRRGAMQLRTFKPGLPTTTPNAQGGMLFGVENCVPGFRWYDRKLRRVMTCNEVSTMQFIRDELIGDRPGALEGGSSHANLLDGGARRTVFTVSGQNNDSIIRRLGGAHLLFLIVFNPLRILRMLAACFWELWAEFYDRYLHPDPKGGRTQIEGLFPLLRVVSNVLLRELQTLGLLADIHSGVPRMFTTYGGYDELAHHFGPTSRAALTNLRHIDRRIAEVRRMIRLGAPRPYDLIILSDHGQTRSRPFVGAFGCTLGEAIDGQLHAAQVHISHGTETRMDEQTRYVAKEIASSRLGTVPGVKPATRAVERHVARKGFMSLLRPETVYIDDSAGAVVTYSSCLAHLYLITEGGGRMDRDRIAQTHPGLLDWLRQHEGIGPFFIRNAPGEWWICEGNNSAVLKDGRFHALEGLDPLRHVDAYHESLPELWAFLNGPETGDVVLFGRYDGERVICFDDQAGAHGSLGGPQGNPFILLPGGHPAAQGELRGYSAIYHKVLAPYLKDTHETAASPDTAQAVS